MAVGSTTETQQKTRSFTCAVLKVLSNHRLPKIPCFFPQINHFYAYSFHSWRKLAALIICRPMVGQSRVTFVWCYEHYILHYIFPKVGNSWRPKYKQIIAVNASTLKTYKYLVNMQITTITQKLH